MEVVFWGVRGSYPQSGMPFVKYGGHSSCVSVQADGETIIFDAGSGLINAGKIFANQKNFHILLSHLHIDHILGIPFFAPIWKIDTKIKFYCGMVENLDEKLGSVFTPPFFPVPWNNFPSYRVYEHFEIGASFKIGEFQIHTVALDHPGGGNGFRLVSPQGKCVVYLSDTDHKQEYFNLYKDFCRDADILIYDSTFTHDDYEMHQGWGHSTWEKATELAKLAHVKQLILYHHDPERSDAVIAALEAEAQLSFPATIAAYEGLKLRI